MRKLFPMLVVLLLAACRAESTAPEVPSLTGTWSGSSEGLGLSLTIARFERDVSGHGFITVRSAVRGVSMRGIYLFPEVSMTVFSSGYEDLSFEGKLSGDASSITGVVNGLGFRDEPLVLRRR